jgi:hypothetical protein
MCRRGFVRNSAAILACTNRIWDASPIEPSVMIEKSASSLWAGWGSGLLDLNHTRSLAC